MFDLEELKATFGMEINFMQIVNLKTKVRKLERFYNKKHKRIIRPDV